MFANYWREPNTHRRRRPHTVSSEQNRTLRLLSIPNNKITFTRILKERQIRKDLIILVPKYNHRASLDTRITESLSPDDNATENISAVRLATGHREIHNEIIWMWLVSGLFLSALCRFYG